MICPAELRKAIQTPTMFNRRASTTLGRQDGREDTDMEHMTDAEFDAARLKILEEFWFDMQGRGGMQAPVRASMTHTATRLGKLYIQKLEESSG